MQRLQQERRTYEGVLFLAESRMPSERPNGINPGPETPTPFTGILDRLLPHSLKPSGVNETHFPD